MPWKHAQGRRGKLHSFLTLVQGGGKHHAPAALPSGKKRGTHCLGAWVGPTAGQERIISWSFQDSKPRPCIP